MGDWERIFKYLLYAIYAILVVCLFNRLLSDYILSNLGSINNYFFTYKETVTAFSGFASVFVACVAIWYSMQANDKQRELQKQQIELEEYKVKVEAWRALKNINNFIVLWGKFSSIPKINTEEELIEKFDKKQIQAYYIIITSYLNKIDNDFFIKNSIQIRELVFFIDSTIHDNIRIISDFLVNFSLLIDNMKLYEKIDINQEDKYAKFVFGCCIAISILSEQINYPIQVLEKDLFKQNKKRGKNG